MLAKEFFLKAKNDLNASKLLYESKDYSNAAYHLQQSIEKIAKAYGLLIGLTKQDLKLSGEGHKTPKIGLKIVRDKFMNNSEMLGIIQLLKFYGALNTDDANKKINLAFEALENGKEFASQTKEQILSILQALDSLRIKTKNDITENINETVSALIELSNENSEKRSCSNIIDFVIEFACVFMLGSITFPHEQSRYPDNEIIKYEPGAGIVDTMPDIWKSLEISMKVLDDHFISYLASV